MVLMAMEREGWIQRVQSRGTQHGKGRATGKSVNQLQISWDQLGTSAKKSQARPKCFHMVKNGLETRALLSANGING